MTRMINLAAGFSADWQAAGTSSQDVRVTVDWLGATDSRIQVNHDASTAGAGTLAEAGALDQNARRPKVITRTMGWAEAHEIWLGTGVCFAEWLYFALMNFKAKCTSCIGTWPPIS